MRYPRRDAPRRVGLGLPPVWLLSGACGLTTARLEQCNGIDVDPLCDPFEALEDEVALAALYASHVGPVDAQDIGERFLAEAASLPVGPQVATDGSLKGRPAELRPE